MVDPIIRSGCPRQPDNIIDDDFPVRVDPHVVTHFQRAVGFAIQLKGDRTPGPFLKQDDHLPWRDRQRRVRLIAFRFSPTVPLKVEPDRRRLVSCT